MRPRLGHRPRRRLVLLRDYQQSLPARRHQEPRGLRAGRREQYHGRIGSAPARLVCRERRYLPAEHRLARIPARADACPAVGPGTRLQPYAPGWCDEHPRGSAARAKWPRRTFHRGRRAVRGCRQRRLPGQGGVARPVAGLCELPDGPLRCAKTRFESPRAPSCAAGPEAGQFFGGAGHRAARVAWGNRPQRR